MKIWMARGMALICLCLTACGNADKVASTGSETNTVSEDSQDTASNTILESGELTESTSDTTISAVASNGVSSGNTTTNSNGKTQSGTTSTIAFNQFVQLTAGEGQTIYRPKASGGGYRYGPSILLEEGGAINAWFSATGNSEQWDWIKYRRSTDGGKTWTDDKAVLKPTADSEDAYAACDPGVVKIEEYYYIGYTATVNKDGVDNHIFLGRSKSPTGPYEKWNGSGWGGENPKPIITFTGTKGQFGAGEPSFVVVNNTIYMYYTWFDVAAYTRIATAPADDPNWPAKLTYKKQISREKVNEDSWDVKYIEDYGVFIATSIVDRMTKNPSVIVRQSTDGIQFTRTQYLKGNIAEYAHNGGISGRENGHMRLSDANFYCYAYGSADSWGAWCTIMNPITVSLVKQPNDSQTTANRTYSLAASNYTGAERTTDLSAKVCLFRLSIQSDPADIQMVGFTSYDRAVDVSRNSGISYSGYDSQIIQVNDHKIIPLKNGSTQITATYQGLTETIRVKVGDYWSVRVSSNEYFWDKQYLIDNNPTTIFSTTGGSKVESIIMWKPAVQTVKGITITPRGGGENFTTSFTVEYSTDGNQWSTILSKPTYTNPNNNNAITLLFSSQINATHIRLTSQKHGSYFQLAEMMPITYKCDGYGISP